MSRLEAPLQPAVELIPKATHFLAVGSIIYVLTRTGRWWASCILSGNPAITPPLPVALIGVKTISGHSEPNMQAFIATEIFTVYYPKHDRHASRLAGTELLAYPTGLTPIRRQRGK